MSRDPREPSVSTRDETERPEPNRDSPSWTPALETRHAGRAWSPAARLDLPRSPDRQRVSSPRGIFRLRDSDAQILATVGVFRTVCVHDLRAAADGDAVRGPSRTDNDLGSLRGQGLLQAYGLVINGRSEQVVVLTGKGRELLDNARIRRESPIDHRSSVIGHRLSATASPQCFYAGLVQPRQLAHDAQLYRLFLEEERRLRTQGASVRRVVLEHELIAEYHAWVHEQQQAGRDPADSRRAFADTHDLPFADEHIHLPDIRIEYETADGWPEHSDLELATEHYSRSQISGKAGFRVYRAAGAGGRRGATPADPHHLERIT